MRKQQAVSVLVGISSKRYFFPLYHADNLHAKPSNVEKAGVRRLNHRHRYWL